MPKVNIELGFEGRKIERPNKTLEEIQAEVDAFNKAQRDMLEIKKETEETQKEGE